MDPDLVWTYCEVCGGILLPFDSADKRIFNMWLDNG